MLSRLFAVTLAASAAVLAWPLDAAVDARKPAPNPPFGTLTVGPDTRLLLISPHPDDEVLGAGGLLQHLRAANGVLRIVYLTSGEAYREGVQIEDHVKSPTPSNYRAYGRQREREAREALQTLGFGADSLTFMGFPNGGLHRLMTRYWSERRAAYRSPYTRRDRPDASEILVDDTEFRGEDLTQELAQIISNFRPTLILVPRKEDQHTDHCAAWFFLADALSDVTRVHPDWDIDVLTYIVHYYSWPFEDEEPHIAPPEGLGGGISGWLHVPLTRSETATKRKALTRYKSQMDVMAWFLMGFARRDEWVSRPRRPHITLPVRHSLCDSF